ncbi:MAG: aminoacyl-tRNA hydrolase [Bacteroidia bacterium]|nr:aminoacyl-tRNA hydrolase [Bacteroidia bacterium]
MKYLIAGLGNIGVEYQNTRHNSGFMILDAFAKASNIVFTGSRYAFTAALRYKGRTFLLIKPTTFMNLSGKAVNYWLQKENIPVGNMLVVCDDIALPFGTIRLRPKGSDAGHNGLKDISEILGHENYARLRFGIGNDFYKGGQVDYVLSEWMPGEKKLLPARIDIAIDAIKSFGTSGITFAMNNFNNR